ncbi:MAG: PIG-L deacetylase family protein [Promethearchaeota archaeon]
MPNRIGETPLFTEAGWIVGDSDLPKKREERAKAEEFRTSVEKYLEKPVRVKEPAVPAGTGGRVPPTSGARKRRKGKEPLKVLVIGAHPDDCDLLTGGLSLRHSRAGNRVKYVSVTNGNAGHHFRSPAEVAFLRENEAKESAKALGVEYECLGVNDGHVWVNEEQTRLVVKVIREFHPDLVITHRPYDYHRDHRYVGQLVMDASYMLIVPHYCPEFPVPSHEMPVIAYAWDSFRKPYRFSPDVFVNLSKEEHLEKTRAIGCHESQLFEWLPWTQGMTDLVNAETDEDQRLDLAAMLINNHYGDIVQIYYDRLLKEQFGEEAASYEAFEICEYGKQPNRRELKRLFPGGYFPKRGVVAGILADLD